jgi:hypothetical protein
VITLHIGNVRLLAKTTACDDDDDDDDEDDNNNNNKGEAFFYIQVLLPQVSDVNLNQQGVEF